MEILDGKFGNVNINHFLKMISECNVKKVEFVLNGKYYEPVLNKDFINFLIGDKKDPNSTIRKIITGELDTIYKEFSNVYNNFSKFQNALGNKIHLNKLLPFLQKNPYVLLPNEYMFTKDIIENIIKSFYLSNIQGVELNNKSCDNKKECVIKACNFYHSYLENRYVSSIPRVSGISKDNYEYEVIKLNDPIILTLGYITGCCFRMNGQSTTFLEYCSSSPYARVIIIKNTKKEICGMIPIIRNGNVLVGNSIETNSNGIKHSIYNALKECFEDIMSVIDENEDDPVIACCVSNLHNNCFSKDKVGINVYPIRKESFYTNYNGDIYYVVKKGGVTSDDFKLYSPTPIYMDERPKILCQNWHERINNGDNTLKQWVMSISYQLKVKDYYDEATYIIASEDWFIAILGKDIKEFYLDKDPRAKEECLLVKEYLESIKDQAKYYITVNYNELEKINIEKSKNRILK